MTVALVPEVKFCVNCQFISADHVDLEKSTCSHTSALKSISYVTGTATYKPASEMRTSGKCGPEGSLWLPKVPPSPPPMPEAA